MKTWISWDTGRRLVYLEWTCPKCKQVVTVSNPLRGEAELKMQNERAQHVCQGQAGGKK